MTADSRARLTTVVVAVAFTAYAAMVVTDLIREHGGTAPYFVSDWQINYAAGFVRRGLPGEFARQLFVHFGVDTRTTIVVMQVLLYVVFFVACAALFSPVLVRHPMFAFAVVSPMAMAFKALDSGVGVDYLKSTTGAKEIVFLSVLALQALLSTRDRTDPGANNTRLLALGLAWAAAVLVHEGLFFFVPFSVAVAILTARVPFTPFKLGLIALPSVIAFGSAAIFHGDPSYGEAICASLGASAPAKCMDAEAIAWLTRPATMQVLATYYVIVQPPYILLASAQAAMLGGVGLALVALDRGIAKSTVDALKDPRVLVAAIACIVVPIPAFLASGQGRFLHVWFCRAAIVMAAFLSRRAQDSAQSSPALVLEKAGVLTSALLVVLFLAYVTTWNAHGACCPDQLGSGFLGRLLTPIFQRLSG